MTSAAIQKTSPLSSSVASPKQDHLPGKKTIIAVDGPAASGKGTLARNIAARLGYAYLDTGALYRAVALATLEMAGNPGDIQDVQPALEIIKRNLTTELLTNPLLRTPQVAAAASKVSALPEVRQQLFDYQRDFAMNPPAGAGGVVMDGRDIGTVICPDADVKLFVTASAEERARRRFEELKETYPDMTQEQVLEDLRQRDQRDQNRAVSPTLPAENAYIIDTTDLDVPGALSEAISVIRTKFLADTSENLLD